MFIETSKIYYILFRMNDYILNNFFMQIQTKPIHENP